MPLDRIPGQFLAPSLTMRMASGAFVSAWPATVARRLPRPCGDSSDHICGRPARRGALAGAVLLAGAIPLAPEATLAPTGSGRV